MGDLYQDGILRNVSISTDSNGNPIVNPTYDTRLLLSKSQIELIDLISEGPIQGLVSGKYNFSGNIGEIGWRSAQFSGFKVPTAYPGTEYLRSIYLNQIPVLDDLGKFNFQNINLSYTNGLPNGEAIRTLSPNQSVSRTIGERLRGGENNAKFYRIFNKNIQAIVITIQIQTLSKFIREGDNAGQTDRTSISYSIYYRPIFSNKSSTDFILGGNENLLGKLSRSTYVRPTRINFPSNFSNDKSFIGWEIKVVRSTPDSTESILSNTTIVDSITEIQQNIFTYPNSALVRQLFDAEYFNAIPERFFDVEMLKVKIPGNYNPVLRTYSTNGFGTTNGSWNGQFATGLYYTNNPAWCYYDLLTNQRYGLGKYVSPDYTDKWEIYNIAKYCDTLVSDGEGGLEPRFTCNLWLAQREDAYKVINDMASIFRGLSYYANGYIYTANDAPKTEKWEFTNANIENGEFSYSSTSKRSRHSVAIVRYNDPKNFYAPAIEYVEDFDAMRKYGLREIEVSAFGCTSRGQAIRLGRWLLLSENLESETVSFIAGIESAAIRPGDIFKVSDVNKKTKRYGGRLLSINNIINTATNLPTGASIVLDYKIDTEPNIEYQLSVLTPTYNYNGYSVTGISSADVAENRSHIQKFNFSGFQSSTSGSRGIINLYSGFNTSDYIISGNPIWVVELSDKYSAYSGSRYFTNTDNDYYRLINISEKETNKFIIEAIQYNPQKYIEIESGLLYDRTALQLSNIPASPRDLSLNIYGENQKSKTINYSFIADDIDNINTFKVYAKSGSFADLNVPSSQYLINILPNNINYGNYIVTNPADYNFRVYASNDVEGILSPNFASGVATVYQLYKMSEYVVSSLQIQNTDTGLYLGNIKNGNINIIRDNDLNPIFNWQVGSDGGRYTIDANSLKHRITVRPYNESLSRVPSTGIYYEATGIENFNWQFNFNTNIAVGPLRDYQVVVEVHDDAGMTSAGNTIGQAEADGSLSWINNPQGYDIISIRNPVVTGIELQDNIPTYNTENGDLITGTNNYQNNAYFGPNGDVVIHFSSGLFDSDIVGGYLYTSTGQFPKTEAMQNTGYWGTKVTKSLFAFDPNYPYVYHPTAGRILNTSTFNLDNIIYGYMSVSFFDSIDKAILDKGKDISSGLFISNNALVYKDISIGRMNIGGSTTVQTIKYSGDANPISNWGNVLVIASGAASGITSILYTDILDWTGAWSS